MIKPTVLIIDDEALIRSAIKSLFEDYNYTVLEGEDTLCCPAVAEGRTCKRTRACVDILLIDNTMPGMSGLEFIRSRSLRNCKLKNHQISLFSGNISSQELSMLYDSGCHFFQKPTPLIKILTWAEGNKPPMTL